MYSITNARSVMINVRVSYAVMGNPSCFALVTDGQCLGGGENKILSPNGDVAPPVVLNNGKD